MKKLIMLVAVCATMFAQAGWFGMITKGDVKDAFMRQTYLHEAFMGAKFVPGSVVAEKTETKNVWRITWKVKRSYKEKYDTYSELFHSRKTEKHACVLSKL